MIDRDVYPDLDQYWDDLVAAYRDEVAALYAAGCRYLQMDDVSFAYLCDPDFREQMVARGEDPDELVVRHRDAMNAVIAGRPDDLLVSTHMCRGNFRSRWVASGGYEPIAEPIFGGLDVDAFFLEFDSDRAGGFEPLRHLAAGKTAVLGLVTTQDPRAGGSRRDPHAASTRPPSSCRSTSWRSARSAGSRAPTTATTSPRTTSGASSSWSSASARRCGDNQTDDINNSGGVLMYEVIWLAKFRPDLPRRRRLEMVARAARRPGQGGAGHAPLRAELWVEALDGTTQLPTGEKGFYDGHAEHWFESSRRTRRAW